MIHEKAAAVHVIHEKAAAVHVMHEQAAAVHVIHEKAAGSWTDPRDRRQTRRAAPEDRPCWVGEVGGAWSPLRAGQRWTI